MSSVCPPGTSWDDASQWCRPDGYGDPENPEDPTDPSGCPPGTEYQYGQGCVPGPGGGGNNGGCPSGTSRGADGACHYPDENRTSRPGRGEGEDDDFNFTMPSWPSFNYDFDPGEAPVFTARRFSAPNPDDILNDPSYKWRLGQSLSAYENSAAARGNLRTGATAKGLIDYAGNSASQEYANAFDRALKVFQTDYQGDLDEYKPKLITYQTRAAGRQRALELQSADLWRKYLADLDWTKYLLSEAA